MVNKHSEWLRNRAELYRSDYPAPDIAEKLDESADALDRAIELLLDYQEKAVAMRRYMEAKPPKVEAMTAICHELSLDGGNKVEAFLKEMESDG